MVAIRDDEDRVRFAGYNVALIKAVVFAVSAAMAGLAGALFVPQVGIISPANLGIVPSIEFVLLVAVGGRGTLLGAVAGAILVSWARSTFSEKLPGDLAVLLRRALHRRGRALPPGRRRRRPSGGGQAPGVDPSGPVRVAIHRRVTARFRSTS